MYTPAIMTPTQESNTMTVYIDSRVNAIQKIAGGRQRVYVSLTPAEKDGKTVHLWMTLMDWLHMVAYPIIDNGETVDFDTEVYASTPL